MQLRSVSSISRDIKYLNLSKFKPLLRKYRSTEIEACARVKNIFIRSDELIYGNRTLFRNNLSDNYNKVAISLQHAAQILK